MSIRVFTDASIRNKALGIGVYSASKRIAGRIMVPESCSTFGETTAVLIGLYLHSLHHPKSTHFTICTDSQSTIDFIRYNRCPDRFVKYVQAIRHIVALKESRVQFEKVKAHSCLPENDQAHRLARIGTTLLEDNTPKYTFKYLDINLPLLLASSESNISSKKRN
ncbi:hypothetical protein EB118_06995 [bacterium]|nr:hypothetical protein [bacterium]NDC94391.1 hypothetical protein [bacterium]NDD83932.1 hypothetical protein [bacterium]NDG29827.1 hypothetical protein [bacterium]